MTLNYIVKRLQDGDFPCPNCWNWIDRKEGIANGNACPACQFQPSMRDVAEGIARLLRDEIIMPVHGGTIRADFAVGVTIDEEPDVPDTPRVAYFVLESHVASNGNYIALIAKEGEKGYHATDWHWGRDYRGAQQIAEDMNTRLGLSPREAAKIIARTM